MSVQQRIIKFIEEGCDKPSWEEKELRAIGFEVRKLEDRIKQLEEMYEGVIGENPALLGSNVMGLLKRELTGTQKRIKQLEDIGNELRECASRIGTVASGEGSVIRRAQEAVQAWDKEVKL